MYHTVAKDIDEYNGGSDLMRNMAQYVERKPKKFSASKCKMYITVNDTLNLCTVIKMYCSRTLVLLISMDNIFLAKHFHLFNMQRIMCGCVYFIENIIRVL